MKCRLCNFDMLPFITIVGNYCTKGYTCTNCHWVSKVRSEYLDFSVDWGDVILKREDATNEES